MCGQLAPRPPEPWSGPDALLLGPGTCGRTAAWGLIPQQRESSLLRAVSERLSVVGADLGLTADPGL